jgi:catechol 2,3-dioxygenase-like lactoylglutathione lyase family enzyme
MTVLALEHVNIRSADPARTLGFFRDVLLMKVGSPPGSQGPASWAYAENGVPVVHVGSSQTPYPTDATIPYSPASGGGAVHHVALNCVDFEGVKARLAAFELDYYEQESILSGIRQIFVSEPNGILFELNFRDGAAA